MLTYTYLCRPLEVQVMEYLLSRTRQTFPHCLVGIAPDTETSSSASSYLSAHCSATLTELGGDSLTAMRLSGLLKEHFSAEISAQVILTHSLQQLLQLVFPQSESSVEPLQKREIFNFYEETSITFLQQYSKRKKEKFLINQHQPTVLLTGATGFLGRFILLELLQSENVNKVYCIVKGRNGK